MSTPNQLSGKNQMVSTKNLQRLVMALVVLVVVALIGFSGYYYWDRYVHLGDKSPLDLNIEHLEQAIRDDPQNPEPRVALAEYYLTKGLNQDAVQQAGQVLEAYPDNQGAMLIAGVSQVRLDQPEAALPPLEEFVAARKDQPMAQTDPALETAYYFLGDSYLRLNRPDEAVEALEAALVINHTDADAIYQLGQAYQAAGRYEDAVAQYHDAVKFVPDFTEAYTGMIDSYGALNQPDYVAFARGMQAFTLRDFDTAKTHLDHAVNALPEFAPAFLGLGLTLEKLDQPEAALTAIQRALQLDPNNFAAQQAHGRLQTIIQPQG